MGMRLLMPLFRRVPSLVILLVFALAGCAMPVGQRDGARRSADGPAAAPKRLRVGILREPTVVFPKVDLRAFASSAELETLVNSGLAGLTHDRIAVARLAEALPTVENGLWTILPDGRMETIWRIREGASWHDGTPLTASDLLFTLQVHKDKELPNFNHAALDLIADAEEIDSRTVVVRWRGSYVEADELFGPIAMSMPRHLLESAYTSDKPQFLNLPYWSDEHVGTGPYRLRQFVRGSYAVVEAFDRYALGRPKIDEIEMRFLASSDVVAPNILAGAIDATMGIGIGVAQAVQIRDQWRDGGITDGGLTYWARIHPQFLNPNPAVVGESLSFRRALYHAINRQEIVDTIQLGLAPVSDLIPPPTHPWYPELSSSVVRYEFDRRRATQLLEEVGYVRGADGFLQDRAGVKLSVEIRTTYDNEARRAALFAIADYWQRVGVGVLPTIIAEAIATDNEYRATFPAFEITRAGSDVRGLAAYTAAQIRRPENNFRGRGGTNYPRYSNPELDSLTERFLITIPQEERKRLAGEIIHHLTDNVVQMGIYHDPVPTLVTNRLSKNFVGHSWNAHEWELAS